MPQSYNFAESELHQFLSYFAYQRFSASSLTIRHQASTRKDFGEWLHPDVVAVRYSSWEDKIRNLSAQFGDSGMKLYSFEIKKELSFTNLREAFFQAVSNSSWSHEGYLTAAEIDPDTEFLEELQRLSSSFGIGIIELGVEDADNSEILMPARERDVVDWDTLNKLANKNPDIDSYLGQIINAMKTGDFKYGQWDSPKKPDPLSK